MERNPLVMRLGHRGGGVGNQVIGNDGARGIERAREQRRAVQDELDRALAELRRVLTTRDGMVFILLFLVVHYLISI